MEQQLEQEDTRFNRAVEVAKIGAASRENVAGTSAGSRETVAKIGAESRETVAETGAGARVKTAEIGADASKDTRSARKSLAKFKSLQSAAILNDREAAKATAAGDADNAAIYRKHADEFRAKAEAELAEAEAPEETVKINGPKLYTPPENPGEVPSFSSEVKKPEDVLSAMQQMVDDGVITDEQARETLTKLGFKKKGK
jgi:hypothetical protein